MLRLRKFMFDRVYLGEAARGEHERAQRALRGLFDHYMEHPEDVPEGEAGRERLPARRRLPRRDDRPLLHRHASPSSPSPRRRASDGADLRREPRAGQADGGHRRGRLRPHRPAASGRPLGRPLPVPRGAHPVVLGRRAGKALPLLRLRSRRRHDQVRRREGGARLRRGGGAARRPLRGRAGAGERGPAGRGAPPAAPPAGRAARPHRDVLRAATSGTPRRRARPARIWPSAGSGRRCCAPSRSATRRAPGTRC